MVKTESLLGIARFKSNYA